MFWQPSDANVPARNSARALARVVDARFNLFVSWHNMIGLGARRMGHRSGMPSIAADIMAVFPEYSSFLAMFYNDGAYILVAARNGIILADKIFMHESDARREYFALAEMPDWGAFVAPAAWGAPRAVERTLADVLDGRHAGVLRYISRARTILFSLLLLCAFAVGVFWLYRDSLVQVFAPRPQIAHIDPELAAEYKRQVEESNRQLDAEYEIKKNVPEPLVLPYDNLPDVYERADLCYQAMGFLMQPIPGWIQVSVRCDESDATVEFRRDYGTLGDFYVVAGDLMPGAIVQERGDSALTVRAVLPKIATHASQDERDADTIVRNISTIFQGIDITPDIDVVVDTITNGVETVNVNVLEIAAASKLIPSQFMKIFDDFGGVYMTRTEWNATNRTWNYEVIIYAK
ncbi:MAG: type 4b pilus protein PilO2 [Alphaproteobacteria bacterium]|nr:type 4b pilus protein PilO2 [Alphaproteobacteria bacterium]